MQAYQKISRLPLGRKLFSVYASRVAPYFKTVSPRITQLEHGYCEAFLRKKHSIENHIGTVHVIAICNGLEFAMGVMAETSIPTHLRWIPKGMHVDYIAKAGSDIILKARLPEQGWEIGNVIIEVEALRAHDTQLVVKGKIYLWVAEK